MRLGQGKLKRLSIMNCVCMRCLRSGELRFKLEVLLKTYSFIFGSVKLNFLIKIKSTEITNFFKKIITQPNQIKKLNFQN